MSEHEILRLLDSLLTYERGDIPPPPDIYNLNNQFVEGRLSVFRNQTQWVVAFETITYVPPACAYMHNIYLYGNCIKNQVLWREEELPVRIAVSELWDEATEAFLIQRHHFRILWRDRWIEFTPTPEEYTSAGIVFPTERQHTNDLEPLELLAYLCWKLNSPFFLSEQALRAVVQEATGDEGGDLRLLFQTCEWQHPNVAEGERPSEVPGMRVLARLIALGDTSVWQAFDPRWVNTRFAHVVQVNWEFLYPSKLEPVRSEPLYELFPISLEGQAEGEVGN